MKTKLRLALYKIIKQKTIHGIILEWLTNKLINHPDSEESLEAMVNFLLIHYSKMERKMDFKDQFGMMENILLVNESMDKVKESGKATMKKEFYLNMKNIPKTI